MKLRLKVIPEPPEGTRSVLVTDSDEEGFIFIRGGAGDIDHACGSCGRVLLSGVYSNQVSNIVIKCPACGAFNETIDG